MDNLDYSQTLVRKDDGLHVAVKTIPGRGESEVVYIAPTKLVVILVTLILEIIARTDQGHQAEWKIDYLEFMKGFIESTQAKYLSSYE